MHSAFIDHIDRPVLAVDIGGRTMRGLLHAPGAAPGEKSGPHALALPAPSADAEFNPKPWLSLVAGEGLPRQEAILVSALEPDRAHSLAGKADGRGPRVRLGGRLWDLARSGGVGIGSLMAGPLTEDMLRLGAIQRITGYPVLDSAAAFALGLMADSGVSGRARREGVTLLFAGKHTVSAGLVFRDRLLGFFELPAQKLLPPDGSEPSLLLTCLEEFRLGWLPKERAAELGGFSDVALSLPPEAEGFRPLFVTGPRAVLLEGRGRLVGGPDDMALNNCRGLLYGYARLLEEQAAFGR